MNPGTRTLSPIPGKQTRNTGWWEKCALAVLAVLAVLALAAGTAQATDNTGTGGTIVYTDVNGLNPVASPPYANGYVLHTFTSSGTLTIPTGVTADVLVVAGGGGGGYGSGGGGGAGGVIYSNGFAVSSGSVTVTVGGGGVGGTSTVYNTSGQNSVFSTLTAIGGGSGEYALWNTRYQGARSGGSGGGGAWNYNTNGLGTAGQGYNGGSFSGGSTYPGAGGGGAGAVGASGNGSTAYGGAGGAGVQYSISGTAQYYGGGGGGGADNQRVGAATGGAGGSGVGGTGGASAAATAGTANTGGGGGGAGNSGSNLNGAAGGSGIVIVRYPYVNGPVILTLNPVKNATGVAVSSSLVVTFDQNVQKGTGNIVIKRTSDDSVLQTIDVTSGQVTVSGATATIIPPSSLPLGTPCYVQIAAGAFTATADSSLFAGITDKTTWSFKTAGGAPIILTLNPANSATGVADNPNLVVTFDQAAQKGTGNIVIKKTSDNSVLQTISVTSGQVTISGAVATIVLSGNLPLGTPCYVQIAAGAFAATADSTPFAGITDTVTWTFTTMDAPTVSTLNPVNNATGVGVGGSLVVTFNQNVQKGTGNIVIKRTSDNSVIDTIDVTSGQVTVSGAAATIVPSGTLPANTPCYVQIAAGAFTATIGSLPPFAGITDTTSWSFTTGTYNFTFTPTAANTYAWTTAGNWMNGVPVSATNATVNFFSDTTTALGNGTIAINNDPATLTLNTLTLNGKGAAATAQTTVNIGTAGKAWTFDGTTPTINLNGVNGTYTLTHNVAPNITLNQNLTVTGNGSAGFGFSGNITGNYSITKSGSSTLALSGSGNNYSGGTTLNAGGIYLGHNNALGTGTLTFGGNATLTPGYTVQPVIPNGVTVNSNVTATFNIFNGYGYNIKVNGPLAGGGTIAANSPDSGGGSYANFQNAANTFTGSLVIGGTTAQPTYINVNSLADSTNNIQLYGNGYFTLNGGTAAPLLFNSRQIELLGTTTGSIVRNNNGTAANTITINTDLKVTGVGAKALTLGGANTGNNTFAGRIVNGSGATGLTKADAGTWIVSGSNTYSGATAIQGGILSINSITNVNGGASALGAVTNVAGGTIAIGATTAAGTLQYTGSGHTSDRVINLAGTTGGVTLDQSGSGLWKFTSAFTATGAGAKTLTLQGSTTGTGEIAGAITNSSSATALTKAGTGTWTLSGANAYSGATTLSGGTLSLSALDVVANANPLGQSAADAGNLLLADGTTLKYTGAAASCDRLFTLNTTAANGTVTLDASGTGPVNFSNPGSVACGTAVTNKTRTLALTGSNTGLNTLAAVIGDNGVSVVSLTKSGTGTWVLSGNNTYTGGTIVNGGTLRLTSSAGLSTSTSVYLFTGVGTLDLAFTGTNRVFALYINGIKQPNGVYGATTAPITGTGYLWAGEVDTDGDGIPDSWTMKYFGHPTAQAGDLSRAGDDPDGDGLTNLQEYQLGTNPLLADTDGDGLTDGAEVNLYHTDPTKADTDGDGLSDYDEIFTYHTNPLLADTDSDGVGDWYEVMATFTDPNDANSKANIPYPLPRPNSTPPASNKPVKVFILSGQSNMVGEGDVNPIGTAGTLATIVKQQNKFPDLLDTNGNWTVWSNVMYRGVISAIGNGPLTPGYGATSVQFGPELGFGHVMGYYFNEPVLLIKASIGNRALGWDYLPPGSPEVQYNGYTYAAYGESPDKWLTGSTPTPIGWYAGREYDECFLNEADWSTNAAARGFTTPVVNVVDILDNFATQYPQWSAQGFQIGGYVWFQGNRDIGTGPPYTDHYETNMVQFIKQLRAYYVNRYPGKCSTNTPFVLATGCGDPQTSGNGLVVANAQLAASDPVKHPEFAGNVKTMDTRAYWRSLAVSPNGEGYHYYHNAETYMLTGDALGRGMISLLSAGTSGDYSSWAAQWPGANLSDPNADFDGDGLSNDYERIWGLNPTNAASRNAFASTTDLAAGTFRYTRRAVALSGLSYTVWTSPDLKTWTQDTSAVQTASAPVNGVETVTVNLSPALLGGPRLYVRMRAQ